MQDMLAVAVTASLLADGVICFTRSGPFRLGYMGYPNGLKCAVVWQLNFRFLPARFAGRTACACFPSAAVHRKVADLHPSNVADRQLFAIGNA